MRISPDVFGQTVVAIKAALDDLFVTPEPDLSALGRSAVAAHQAIAVVLERALRPAGAEEPKPARRAGLKREIKDYYLGCLLNFKRTRGADAQQGRRRDEVRM